MNTSADAPWTFLRLLDWTARYLQEKGADSPRLDAEVLLAHVCECSRIDLYTRFSEVASEAARNAFKALVQRRAAGEPVAYLVGHKEFYSRNFGVSPAVLIPRPETEFVVIAVLDWIARTSADQPLRFADIGTGSGVLAITLALEKPDSRLVASDSQQDALAVARQNAADHGVEEKIEFCCGDLFAAIDDAEPFDCVVSNPPYVSSGEYAELPPTVREYEPQVALMAGERGTEVIEKLCTQSLAMVKRGGVLVLEISPMIEQTVCNVIQQTAGWRLEAVRKDHGGHSRVLVAERV